jgi:hypothetical protein
VKLLYQLDINEFQGRRRLQLLVQNMEVVEAENVIEANI